MQRFYPTNTREDSQGFPACHPSPVPYIPLISIEGVAQRIFKENFSVMTDSCMGSMESATGYSSPASLGGTSVGLAVLAIMRKDSQIMHLARKRYCSALHLLARAVQDPIQSNAESSVAAGFILSMFEVGRPPWRPSFNPN